MASVWKANSSELNLFFPPRLDGGVNAAQRSFLYWDDSSKASPLLAIKLPNKRLLALVRTSSQLPQSQTLLHYCAAAVHQQEQRDVRIKREPTLNQNFFLSWVCPPAVFSKFLFLLSNPGMQDSTKSKSNKRFKISNKRKNLTQEAKPRKWNLEK